MQVNLVVLNGYIPYPDQSPRAEIYHVGFETLLWQAILALMPDIVGIKSCKIRI